MDDSPWVRLRAMAVQLGAAPHRLFFLAGAIQLVLTQVYWMANLAAFTVSLPGFPGAAGANPFLAHGFLMIYGIFPFFIIGFLFTAYPRWLEGPDIPKSAYRRVFLALVAGMLCAYLGIFAFPPLLAVSAALFLLGYLGAVWQLGLVYRLSPHRDKRHEAYVWSWLAGGAVGLALFIAGMYQDRQAWIGAAFSAALWLCLAPLTVTVCYRLIPFFSSRALPGYRMFQAAWVLPLVAVFSIGHFLLRWGFGTPWCLISDLPFLGLALYLSIRWGLLSSFRNQLLAMLHVGFAWLPVALALYVTRGLLSALGNPFSLGFAPLHALGIGFLTSTLLAMATRVSLGHSGRPLAADRIAWWTFWGIGAVAVLRICSALPWLIGWRTDLWLGTSILWLLAVIPWTWRYGALYLHPRADNRPG
ncbi:NnrS family protein [Acidithiobacillus sulfuriphilus]|uniref:NnrS family protein n=1 Tax=Acidithiobacillus sulfuriphilus TaxID=1867749 RepID=UPI003F5E446E